MSADARMREIVTSIVNSLTGRQDARLEALEGRLKALEDRMAPVSAQASHKSSTGRTAKSQSDSAANRGEASR